MTPSFRAFRSLLLGTALAATTDAAAQSIGNFHLPSNYLSRFNQVGLVVSTEAGYGIRYFPLPIEPDLRFSLVRHQNFWEYNLNTWANDTYFGIGMFNWYEAAPVGIPKVELTYTPWKGLQFSGMVQDFGGLLPYTTYAPFSKFSGGYAFTVWDGRIRVLNNVGLGFKSYTTKNDATGQYEVTRAVAAPFTQTEASGGYSQALNKQVDVRLNAAARLFTYPLQQRAEASVDLSPGISVRPFPGFSIDVSHFARYSMSPTDGLPLPDLGQCSYRIDGSDFCQYQSSNLTASYRFQNGNPEFGPGMLRTTLDRNWIGDYTYLRGEILFNFRVLPVLVGPSIGYQFGPNGTDSRWLFSLTSAGK
ncbi:hypothetical protein [Deinococcus ficus]|uniref:hypothetical protein n=1 Tax=Deinococcus ficus TaxID=317577 RepID=UPI00174D5DEF|nr:hypothetical protein [Deinococcus ficus]GHF71082.1 hypothetical protein GCM10017782_05720 [Deinococcus ficus]